MITIYFDFNKLSCEFAGWTTVSVGKSIILSDNSVTCSAEDIIAAYQQYGETCVKHLSGVFSFALWDEKKKQLMVVRDKMGERPMYYSQLPTGMLFSTDLKAILPYIKYPAIRPHELAQPIRHNFPIELQHTWIEQINRLRAGEYAIVDKDGLRLSTYFKRDHTPTFNSTKQEAIAESLRLMRQSVKRCIDTAPGPVAVFMSGGIDSTSLAAFAKEIQQEVHVISAGYKGNKSTDMDERSVARRFAQEMGLIYHEIELDVNDFQSYLDEMIPYLDEPCFDVNCMVQYALYKKASEMGFKIILSGLGGDEQFYSYRTENEIIRLMQKRHQFASLYPAKKNLGQYINYVLHNLKFLLWPTDTVKISEHLPVSWTYNDYMKFAENATLQYKNQNIRFKDVSEAYHYGDNLDINRMYDFMFSTFASTLCVYMANKMSAANDVEVRFPLLDPELVTFLDTIPLKMKFDAKRPKQFQKDIMAGIVPEYILYAQKRGFTPPFEFIWDMCAKYNYKKIQSSHVFFNSMVADMMIDNLLDL